jgi:hypothetical protein
LGCSYLENARFKVFGSKSSAEITNVGENKSSYRLSLDNLREYAEEAEDVNDLVGATKYHLERISRNDSGYEPWFEYGCFCMRNGQVNRGEEIFKEILAKNDKHVPR